MAEPKILAFVCKWCAYAGADVAGGQKRPIPAGVRLVRVMCSGRVDPQMVLRAFRAGAEGVLVLGCHPGDCHYKRGNVAAQNRAALLSALLEGMGFAAQRFRMDGVSADEGERFARIVTEMSEAVGRLGPVGLAAVQPGKGPK